MLSIQQHKICCWTHVELIFFHFALNFLSNLWFFSQQDCQQQLFGKIYRLKFHSIDFLKFTINLYSSFVRFSLRRIEMVNKHSKIALRKNKIEKNIIAQERWRFYRITEFIQKKMCQNISKSQQDTSLLCFQQNVCKKYFFTSNVLFKNISVSKMIFQSHFYKRKGLKFTLSFLR